MTFSSSNNLSGFPQPFTRIFPAPIQSSRVPTTADYQYPIGQAWIDTVGTNGYVLVSVVSSTAQWNTMAISPAGAINTATGNSGGAITPTASNINIVGSGVLAFAGSGATLTGSITPGTTLVSTLAGNSGGAKSPTAGAMSIVGTGEVTVAGSGSTLTISVTPAGTTVSTLTGNSGGAISPSSGNINLLGSGALAFTGTGSTVTGAITPGTALISTVTGGSGGALSPTAGNLNILGTSNQITSTGSGSSLTLSLPSAITAPGSVTATTTLTATLGAITATNGNLVLTAAGNKMIRSSVATTTTAGANSIGSVTLVGGTATVSTTAVTANSLIKIWRQSLGSTGANPVGELCVGTIVASTSFVINSCTPASATTPLASDVSVVGWEIIN